MNIKEEFDLLYKKYRNIISLGEIREFSSQLEHVGYNIRFERDINRNIKVSYEPITIKSFIVRLANIFKNTRLELKDYQKYIYKI